VGMRYPKTTVARLLVIPVVAALAAAMTWTSGAWASTGTVLYSFAGGSDGATPEGPVVFDSAGNLYGTTTFGGANGDGTVFKLTHSGSGWTESVIHTFQPADGEFPEAPLVIDGSGNLYGTTFQGGANGHGAVFKLSPGTGTYQVLYSFTGGTDGGLPAGGVVRDSAGNLFGTASGGGVDGQGVVFELTSSGSTWTETVLHNFLADGVDGRDPGGRGALVFDGSGNLYGATVAGGPSNAGVVFELSHSGSTWSETILHSFTGGTDGGNPLGSVRLDASGNVYGTTSAGGTVGDGNVYKLTHSGSTWTETVLYQFPGGASGRFPFAGVIADSAGNLYGTTSGGVQGAGGVVYKLALNGSTWTETVLYTFVGAGNGSFAGLIRDSAGNLYGTDLNGGAGGNGEVVEVTP
jgi:uncharacterized repeat protein (TIGR03803 family)